MPVIRENLTELKMNLEKNSEQVQALMNVSVKEEQVKLMAGGNSHIDNEFKTYELQSMNTNSDNLKEEVKIDELIKNEKVEGSKDIKKEMTQTEDGFELNLDESEKEEVSQVKSEFGSSSSNDNNLLNGTKTREIKVSDLYIGNLKKEIEKFVEVSKDVKYANNRMLITLKPVELGQVEVLFVKNDNKIDIQISLESTKAVEKVEELVEELKTNLENKELKVEIILKEKNFENGEREREEKEKSNEEKGKPKDKGEKINQFEDLVSEMLGEIVND